MPDGIKGVGKIGMLNIPGLAPAVDKTLTRFIPADESGKSVSDRSTLGETTRPELIKAQREKAATDFEALLLQQMVQSMWKTVPTEGMLSGSNEESMYRDMLSEQFAQELAQGQSLGLKDAVLGEMMKKEK